MQSRFYCPSFAYCRFSLLGCRKGPSPLPLSSAGGGVYPVRKQFVPRLRSMPSALPIYRRRSSPSGDAGRGRRPFRFLPQAGACTPLGNNLSPVCGQCRQRFRFTAAVSLPPGMPEGARRPFRFFPQAGACTPLGDNLSPVCGQYRRRFRFTAAVPLPPGMPEGAVAPSPFFRRRGRVPRRGAIFCLSGRSDLLSSSLPSVPKTSAEGKSLPIHRRCSSSSGDAGRGRRPFCSLPQAGACTPPRSDFLFVRTQRLAVLFSSIRSENLCRRKIASDTQNPVHGIAVYRVLRPSCREDSSSLHDSL